MGLFAHRRGHFNRRKVAFMSHDVDWQNYQLPLVKIGDLAPKITQRPQGFDLTHSERPYPSADSCDPVPDAPFDDEAQGLQNPPSPRGPALIAHREFPLVPHRLSDFTEQARPIYAPIPIGGIQKHAPAGPARPTSSTVSASSSVSPVNWVRYPSRSRKPPPGPRSAYTGIPAALNSSTSR